MKGTNTIFGLIMAIIGGMIGADIYVMSHDIEASNYGGGWLVVELIFACIVLVFADE